MVKNYSVAVLGVAIFLAACGPSPTTERNLLGKWNAVKTERGFGHGGQGQFQYEFFVDGSVVQNEKMSGIWIQRKAGTYRLVDPSHIKIDFGLLDYTAIYEITPMDSDRFRVRAGDYEFELHRAR